MANIETLPSQLRNAEIPAGFSSRKRAEASVTDVYDHEKSLPELEREKLRGIHEILTHPNLDRLIARGAVTFGMIKPSASEGVGLPEDDDAAAQEVLSEIGENVVFSLPFKFRRADSEKFYGHLKEKFSHNPEIYNQIIDFTTSSGVTALLIYKKDAGRECPIGEGATFADGSAIYPNGVFQDENGKIKLTEDTVVFKKGGKPVVKRLSQMTPQEEKEFKGRRKYFVENGVPTVKIENAIMWWRDKMGETNPDEAKKLSPNSIRARHSAKLPNNIVHGSDSVEAVQKEVKILDEAIVNLLEKSKN